MGVNLGPLNIKDTYEGLVQISGSQLTDGSGSLIPSLDVTASFASQAGTSGFATTATSASHAVNADTAISASWSNQAGTSGYAVNASSASFANTSGYAVLALTSSHALYAEQAGTSGFAVTASYALNSTPNTLHEVLNAGDTATGDINLTGDINATNITASAITADSATFTSASIGYLQTVTGSAVIIGDAFVVVNSSPTSRYAGIKVYESGSIVPTTASLQFDSVTNDWFYEYTGSDPTNFGAVMFGPEYSVKGTPVYPTANTLVKGNGGHHVVDSSITDDGTDVVVNANISASGFVSASTYYGDGSNLSGIAGGSGFPFVGVAEITGSILAGTGELVYTGTDFVVGAAVSSSVAGTNSAIISGKQAYITSTGENNGIFVGREALIEGAGNGNALIAVEYGGVHAGGSNRVVIGGYGNNINGGGFDSLIGGESNTINTGGYNHIYGSVSSVNGGGNKNVIVGGESNTISGYTRGVVLGGTGLTTVKNDEVVVPNLSVYGETFISSSTLGTGSFIDNLGQEGVATTDAIKHMVYCTQAEYDALTPDGNTMYVISGSGDIVDDLIVSGSLIGDVKAISVASSTGSLDCSTGNYFTLGLANAADTRLEASNIQIGQTINIKITNNATAAGTITFGPEFEFVDGTAFTATAATSAVDIITLVSFDGTSLQTVGVKNFS